MSIITINRPIDGHCHLRESTAFSRTLKDCSNKFSHVLAMPNLKTPIIDDKLLLQYKREVTSYLKEINSDLTVLYTIYATDKLNARTIKNIKDELFAVKLYPQGATTNSEHGISDLNKIYPLLAMLEEEQVPLLIHGEVNDENIDIFDREIVFIDKYLNNWVYKFPKLKIVLEHISSAASVDFILNSSTDNICASVTPHHLHANRNHLLSGGLKPDHYCLPILKEKSSQERLIEAVTSGSEKFYLGTDSAPHTQKSKYSACGCAGIYNSFHAIELYAQIFDEHNAIDKFDGFASKNFAKFHGIERSIDKIKLEKQSWECPKSLPYINNELLTPFKAGEEIKWKILS